jgi:hypothetical protein
MKQVRFEVFTAVTMKNAVFWDMALPAHAGPSLAEFSTLKMGAIYFSETSVDTRSTRRHIPEDVMLLKNKVVQSLVPKQQ